MIRLVEIAIAAVASSFTGVDEMLPLKGGRESGVFTQSREVVVCYTAVFSVVTQRSSTLKTVVKQTSEVVVRL